MPYLLNVTGALNKYVTCNIPQPAIDTGRALQVEYEDEFEVRRTATDWPLVSTSVSASNDLIFLRTGSNVEIRSTGNSTWTVTTSVDLTQFHVFRLRTTFDGTTITRQLYVDGVLRGTTTSLSNSRMGALAAFFGLANDTTRSGEFKYFKRTDFVNPSNNRLYDANASGGTGNVLPETINGFNGTQQGTWPTDNSEWVFYSSGAYTLTADGATFSYSGGIASTIYSRILSADGGSFNYSGGVAATLLNRLIASDGATFGYSGGVSALLYGRALQASGGSFSYSGGVATFVYTPITGYVLNADGGIFSYAGGEAALSFNQNYPTANPNDYTVSAYLSTDSTYTARLSESSTINAIISASSTFNARLN